MGKSIDIDEIIWPIVYVGIDEHTGDALFKDSGTGEHYQIARIPQVWEEDVLILYEEGNPEPIRFHPGDRLIFPKQRQAIEWTELYDAVLYGGAAGGGKSRLLLMAHVWKHLYWNSMGIFQVKTGMFCETGPDLYDRQISMIPVWIPEYLGRWYEQKKIFQFKKKWGGGQILFRSLEEANRFRSVEFGFMTVDESTQDDENSFELLSARLRSPKVKNRSMLLATNPGGPGHGWNRRRFVEEDSRDKPGYSEQFHHTSKGHAFIRCLPTENPLLDPAYYVNLENKQPHVRDAQLYGRWDTFEGLYYDMLSPRVHRIADFRVPDNVPKWRVIDIGTSHPFYCGWVAVFPPTEDHPKGRMVLYRELSILEKVPSKFKEKAIALEKGDKNIMGTIISPDAFRWKGTKVTDGTVAEMFDSKKDPTIKGDKSFNCQSAVDDRIPGWRLLSEYFKYEYHEVVNDLGVLELIIDSPPYFQFMMSCRLSWSSFTNLIHDKHNPEDVQKTMKGSYYPGQGDDEGDGVRYGAATLDPLQKLIQNHESDGEYNSTGRHDAGFAEAGAGSDYSRF